MVTGTRRRDGLSGKPWVAIAAVAGVFIVAAFAVMFFTGGSRDTQNGASAAPVLPIPGLSPHAGNTMGHDGALAYNVPLSAGYEHADIIVPGKGIFLKVLYRGGYEGRYTSGNETQDLRNSGERVIAIENPGPSIFATVKKQDGSSKQALTAEIWKDGARLYTNTSSVPFGEVMISGNT